MAGISPGLAAPQGLESAAMRAIREGLFRSSLNKPIEAPASDLNNALSQQYWSSSCLSYDDIAVDGFYELFGEFPDATTHPDDFPELERLTRLTASPGRRRGVVLLDRRLDPGLASIVEDARSAVDAARSLSPGSTLAAHRALAQFVAGLLGGPQAMTSPSDRWIDVAQTHTTGVIFPISTMYLGGARHRALLYKFLADQLSLPARVVKGRFFAESDNDARLIIPLDGRDMHLDLMTCPGATSPLEDKLALRASNRDSAGLRAAAGIELTGFAPSNQVAHPPTPALAGIAEASAFGSTLEASNSSLSRSSLIAKMSGVDGSSLGVPPPAAPQSTAAAAGGAARGGVQNNGGELGGWMSHMRGGFNGQRQDHLSMEEAMQLAASAALAAPDDPIGDSKPPNVPLMVAASPPIAITGGMNSGRVSRASDDAYGNLPPSPYATAPLPTAPQPSPRVSGHGFGSYPAPPPSSSYSADRNSLGGARSQVPEMASRLSMGHEHSDFQSEFEEMGPPALVSDASGQQYMIQPVRASLDVNPDSIMMSQFGTSAAGRMSASERLRSSAPSSQKTTSVGRALSAGTGGAGGGGAGGGGGMVDVTILPSNAPVAASLGHFQRGGGAHHESMLQWAAMQAAGAGTAAAAVHPLTDTGSVSSLEGAALQNALSAGRQYSLDTTSLGTQGDSLDLSKLYLDGLIHHGSVRMSVPLEYEQRQALLSRASGSQDLGSDTNPPLAEAKQGSRSSGGGVPFPQPQPQPEATAATFSPFSAIQRPLTSSSTEISSPTSSQNTLRATTSGTYNPADRDRVPEMRPQSAMSPREHKRRQHRRSQEQEELHERLSSSLASRGISLNDSISALEEASGWEIDPEELQFGPRIGVGSYGEVYRGQWRQTDVAIKRFLDQDVSSRVIDSFRDEVSIMKRLRHPNIVQFMGACTRPPDLMLVIEYVPRGSLFKLLHRTPGFNPDDRRRVQMALDVARGMNFLHTCRPPIIHRDLKSPNLLVDKDMSVKVCDFGLSRVRHATILSAKSQAGTPEWTAPEVLQSQPCSEASDVYSFGVILWELMTNAEPWEEKTAMQVVGCVGFNNERLAVPTNIDKSMQNLMASCFAAAKDRPTFSEIISVLKKRVSEMNAEAAVNRSKSADPL